MLHGKAKATVIKEGATREKEEEKAGAAGPEKKRPIKVYFALLNNGWLRREVAYSQIPGMYKTPGVELVWENPNQTWSQPIYSNRNAITRRFLATDCDFLMMQDDDIIANYNPLELVFADKDIVGFPAKVRSSAGTLDWVAYTKHEKLNGYTTCNLTGVDAEVDLLRVDIVGTGCILIKRKVLEVVKERFPGGPFTVENDGDGVCSWGTDFAFCKRAGECGFEVFTTPFRTCEHIKEVGLLDISGYEDSDKYDPGNAKYELAWGGWAIQMRDWKLIKKTMDDYNVRRVVEFGAGLSTLLMSETRCVTTFETRQDWADGIAAKGKDNWLETRMWDGVTPPDLSDLKRLDMIFIDGPPGKCNGGPGREAAYKCAADSGVRLIITHDSGRPEEFRLARKYLVGKYQRVAKNGTHSQRSEVWVRRDEA